MQIALYGLDLAQDSGWAFWKPGMKKPDYGLVELPRLKAIGDELYRGHLALRVAIEAHHKQYNLEGVGVAIEAAWLRYGDQNSDDGAKRRRDTERDVLWLFGLATEAATTCHRLGAQPRYFTRAQVLSHWVGTAYPPYENGKPTGKEFSMLSAQARGFKPKKHDTADALGLIATAAKLWEVTVPWDNRVGNIEHLKLFRSGKIVGGA